MSTMPDTINTSELVDLIQSDDRLYAALERMVDFQLEAVHSDRWTDYDHAGFEASDVGLAGWEIPRFEQVGILERAYSSGNAKYFRLGTRDPEQPEGEQWTHFHEEASVALEMAGGPDATTTPAADAEQPTRLADVDVDVDELFTDIVGREKAKKWIRRTIANRRQIHHLLYGPSGSGKSQLLEDVLDLPGAARFVGAGRQSTAAGITNFLLEHRPVFLVVEELEKFGRADAAALLTLTGKGYVESTKGDAGQQTVELDTIVFANANDLERVTPEALTSRMMTWPFDAYTWAEFEEVCRVVLPREHDVDEALAEHIARAVYHDLESADVRDAERIAALAETRAEVDELTDAITPEGS